MAVASLQPASQLRSLRRGLYQAVSDPDIAERVLSLAVACRGPTARQALPWLAPGQTTRLNRDPTPFVEHLAHDICVLAAFVGRSEAPRARQLAGAELWRVVAQLGGWGGILDVPAHYRRRFLLEHLERLVGAKGPLARVPAVARPRPAGQAQVRELLNLYQRSFGSLYSLDVFDIIPQPLTLGAVNFLLCRLAAASSGWSPERVRRAWYILAAKCPTASDA